MKRAGVRTCRAPATGRSKPRTSEQGRIRNLTEIRIGTNREDEKRKRSRVDEDSANRYCEYRNGSRPGAPVFPVGRGGTPGRGAARGARRLDRGAGRRGRVG